MLLPALNKARERAKSSTCTNNLKQIAIGNIAYAGDYQDWLPGATTYNNRICDIYPRYISNFKLFQCPTRPASITDLSNSFSRISSYGGASTQYGGAVGQKLSLIPQPSATMFYTDGVLRAPLHCCFDIAPGNEDSYRRVDFRHMTLTVLEDDRRNFYGLANTLFCDGHVAGLARKDVPIFTCGLWTTWKD
jgi:prepilin-type processing-associated H-X9-DG protein